MEQPTNKRLLKSKQSLKIGLTGGIGAGKSVVAKVFKTIGIPVFDADIAGKDVLANDSLARDEIINLLGSAAYDGHVPNRKFIAHMIFGDDELRVSLNVIIHPKVAMAYETWVNENAGAPYTIKESAISFETGIYKKMDANILVVAPEALRLKRVQERDNAELEAVQKRMDAQWSDKLKVPLTDFLVTNDQNCAVLPQVLEIHKEIIRLSDNKE